MTEARDALGGIPAPVVPLDPSERLTHLNPAAESLFGPDREGGTWPRRYANRRISRRWTRGAGARAVARYPGEGGVHEVTISPMRDGLTLFSRIAPFGGGCEDAPRNRCERRS